MDEATAALVQELDSLVRSGATLAYCDRAEDELLFASARSVADKLEIQFWVWTCTQGVLDYSRENPKPVFTPDQVPTFEKLVETLFAAGNRGESPLVLALDAVAPEPPGFTPLRQVRLLKDLAGAWRDGGRMLLFTGAGWVPPDGVSPYLQIVTVPPPSLQEIEGLLLKHLGLAQEELPTLSRRILGLSRSSVRNLLNRLAVVANANTQDKTARRDRLAAMADEAKRAELAKTQLLDVLQVPDNLQLGGFRNYIAWLKRRADFLGHPDRTALAPRGVLFKGFPGCGKSHAAKWTARQLKYPLVMLDFGRLLDRWVGSSEARLRSALHAIEQAAPLVLFMDEIEKAIAGSHTESSGVTTRLVGQFLTWLSERRVPVFVVATCNQATIPPELTRAGRFDAVFVAPLPSAEGRAEICDAIITELGLSVDDLAREYVKKETHRFSGAEIRQLLVEAAYFAGVDAPAIGRTHLEQARTQITPLAQRPEGRLLAEESDKRLGGYLEV
jgi:hypothetical protein